MTGRINRSFGWKAGNLWYVVLLPALFFSPLALLYMGAKVDNKRWIQLSIVALVVMWICAILGSLIDNNFLIGIFFILWLILITGVLVKSKEFLQLLDAKQRQKEFFYSKLMSQDNNSSQSTGLSLGDKFVADLQKWQQEIEEPQMKKHIQELIDLSNAVKRRNSENSNIRFFTRYSEMINSLLDKYDGMENAKLNTSGIIDAMDNVENNLGKIVGAFRNEVALMYKDDILNMNAETAAFIQDLKNRGLIDNEFN